MFVCEPFFGAVKDRKRPSRSEVEFLEYMLARMNDAHGRLAILVPGSFMLGGMDCVRRVWKKMTDENLVDAIIKLPPNVLYGLTIAPNLLILKKNRTTEKVCFIDASTEDCYTRKVALSVLKDEATQRILETYQSYLCGSAFYDTFVKVCMPEFNEEELKDPFLDEKPQQPKNLRKVIQKLEAEIANLQVSLQNVNVKIERVSKDG